MGSIPPASQRLPSIEREDGQGILSSLWNNTTSCERERNEGNGNKLKESDARHDAGEKNDSQREEMRNETELLGDK